MYKKVFSSIKQGFPGYFGITLGAVMMGAALSVFLVPFKIAPGGISGLATVVHYITGVNVGALILLINAPIFVLGFISFDFRFLLRSFYGTFVLSLATEILSAVPPLTEDIILAAVFGGAIMGCGIATVLRFRGSTGGTDILALVVRKRLPQFSVGQLFALIDGIIIIVAGVLFGESEIILYSAAALFISTRMTDALLEGIGYARLVYIMSGRSLEITRQIYCEMDRGVSALSSVSMYTGKTGRILLCVIRKSELPVLKKIVYSADPNAFVVISDAKEVMGNGFSELKI